MSVRLVLGVGTNDVVNDTNAPAYKSWYRMLKRCYSKSYLRYHPSFAGSSVCNAWLTYSAYKAWFEANHVPGYHLDNSLRGGNGKVYSPETCSFIAPQLSLFLNYGHYEVSGLPNGVAAAGGKYYAQVKSAIGLDNVGIMRDTQLEAAEDVLRFKEFTLDALPRVIAIDKPVLYQCGMYLLATYGLPNLHLAMQNDLGREVTEQEVLNAIHPQLRDRLLV